MSSLTAAVVSGQFKPTVPTHNPGGLFTKIPQEVFDNIMGYVFDKSCLVVNYPSSSLAYPTIPPRPSSNLAILRASGAVGQKALTYFYSRTTFHYRIAFSANSFPTPSFELSLDMIQNVRFTIRHTHREPMNRYNSQEVDPKFEHLITALTSNRNLKKCHIIFDCIYRDFPSTFIPTRFFQALKKLTTFPKVIIEAEYSSSQPTPLRHEGILDFVGMVGSSEQKQNLTPEREAEREEMKRLVKEERGRGRIQCEDIRETIRLELELALGPSIGSGKTPDPWYLTLYLGFHPLGHVAKETNGGVPTRPTCV